MKEKIHSLFPIGKIRNDIMTSLHIDLNSENLIEIFEKDDSSCKRKISISAFEPLTLFRVIVRYDIYQGLWYKINVAIGKFEKPDKNGIMKIEKGIAELSYNSDMTLYDIDIYYDDIHE